MTLKGLSASYDERVHYLLSEGVDQRVYVYYQENARAAESKTKEG
jgi:hypothetical protein